MRLFSALTLILLLTNHSAAQSSGEPNAGSRKLTISDSQDTGSPGTQPVVQKIERPLDFSRDSKETPLAVNFRPAVKPSRVPANATITTPRQAIEADAPAEPCDASGECETCNECEICDECETCQECRQVGPPIMEPHLGYIAEPKTYYYFRPYNYHHIFTHKDQAMQMNIKHHAPYDNSIFKNVYQKLKEQKAQSTSKRK